MANPHHGMRTYPDRQESFGVGQISKSLHRKFSEPFYAKGARALSNWMVSREATLVNRPGTKMAAATKDGSKKSRLFTFDFADNQAYGLEVGDQYLRIKNADGTAAAAKFATVFASSTDGKVYRSLDGGANYTLYTGIGNGMIPITGWAVSGDRIVAVWATGGRVSVSADGGATWAQKVTGLGGTSKGIAWTGTRWVISATGGGVAYSTDGVVGSTWATVSAGAYDWVDITSDGAGNVWVIGTTAGVNSNPFVKKSTDHGSTWGAAVNVDATFVTFTLGYDYSCRIRYHGGAVLAGAVTEVAPFTTERLYRSADGGATWAQVAGKNVSGISTAGTAAYAYRAWGSTDTKLYRTTDGGANWTEVAEATIRTVIQMADRVTAVVYNGSGIFRAGTSWDAGVTWEFKAAAVPSPFAPRYFGGGTLTASVDMVFPFLLADLPKLRMTQSGDVAEFTCLGKPRVNLVRSSDTWSLEYPDDVVPETTVSGLAFVGTPNQNGDADHPIKEWAWKVTWQPEGGRESPPCASLSPGGSGKVCLYPDRPVSVQWSRMPGAARYHVYRGRNGRYGYVGTVEDTGAETVTYYDDASIPVISQDPPQWANPFSSAPPAVAAYFGARKVYGNDSVDPAKLRFSAVDHTYDFDESFVKNADDAFFRVLASLRFEEIRGMLWLGKLLVFTSEAEWAIGGPGGAPVAFDSIEADPVTYNGCAWIQPLAINKRAVFVQSRGNEIRNLYAGGDGWQSDDLLPLSQDLLDGRQVVDWAYSRRPYSILWVVLDDGTLLALSYSDGGTAPTRCLTYAGTDKFEAVTTVPAGGLDVPWFTVQRGAGRYIEIMQPRKALASAADFCGLDSAVYAYTPGAPTATVTGLAHLNGRNVYGLGDGKVYGPALVAGGSVTFSGTAEKWWVGLQIVSDFESLDYAKAWLEQKTVVSVTVETSAEDLAIDPDATLKVGVDLTHLNTVAFSGIREGLLDGLVGSNMAPGARVAVRLDQPVPLEIKGITREIAIGR